MQVEAEENNETFSGVSLSAPSGPHDDGSAGSGGTGAYSESDDNHESLVPQVSLKLEIYPLETEAGLVSTSEAVEHRLRSVSLHYSGVEETNVAEDSGYTWHTLTGYAASPPSTPLSEDKLEEQLVSPPELQRGSESMPSFPSLMIENCSKLPISPDDNVHGSAPLPPMRLGRPYPLVPR